MGWQLDCRRSQSHPKFPGQAPKALCYHCSGQPIPAATEEMEMHLHLGAESHFRTSS
ncbi:hypothetical protein SAMN02746041_00926 [Desulfacinum hydrothermale DSM 13146]|uniref:Uncharacterized protein n=1 Tax=Desulfacinum hydrothermale DSM 13146 TaxID=1121390 RepID=A0A1W1X9Z1_9BACT|nr:hypothetical protein SAMN02746041_00926 [Desulfacinum hydrothermale DSM 13146]